jgi:serine protease
LPGALIANKTPVDPFNDNDHGTAVLGELVADNNGFGVTGIVYSAALGMVNAFVRVPHR